MTLIFIRGHSCTNFLSRLLVNVGEIGYAAKTSWSVHVKFSSHDGYSLGVIGVGGGGGGIPPRWLYLDAGKQFLSILFADGHNWIAQFDISLNDPDSHSRSKGHKKAGTCTVILF